MIEDRVAAKRQQREIDKLRLERGEVTPAELRRENDFFLNLPIKDFEIVAIGGKPIKKP